VLAVEHGTVLYYGLFDLGKHTLLIRIIDVNIIMVIVVSLVLPPCSLSSPVFQHLLCMSFHLLQIQVIGLGHVNNLIFLFFALLLQFFLEFLLLLLILISLLPLLLHYRVIVWLNNGHDVGLVLAALVGLCVDVVGLLCS
jgi:hypothetical protein